MDTYLDLLDGVLDAAMILLALAILVALVAVVAMPGEPRWCPRRASTCFSTMRGHEGSRGAMRGYEGLCMRGDEGL